MSKLFHKLLNNFVFTKPSVHYIAPKVINLYFKNAINPVYRMLNLSKYDNLSLEIIQEKTTENNVFKLNIIANQDKDGQSFNYVVHVASFETRREAEEALIVLKNKLFSPAKTVLKFVAAFTISIFFLFFVLSILQSFNNAQQLANANMNNASSNLTPQQIQQLQLMQQAQMQQAQNNNTVAPVDNNKAYEALQQARQQADKIIAEGTKNQNAPTQEAAKTEVPQDPAVKDFVNSLGK